MLFGIKLKVYIVKKSDDSPIIALVAVAELVCIVFHNAFNSKRVSYVERIFIIFFQQFKCLLSCNFTCSHIILL